MSQSESKKAASAPVPGPESQSDRWIKYGSNVALSAILVLVLAVLLTWFAQHARARVDLTAGGSLSLKPQTISVLDQLKQKITLVSLYARPDNNPQQAEMAQRVSDLLDEYRNKSSKIDVKVIDPIKQTDKLEALHKDFVERYGSQIGTYKDYLEDWKKETDKLKKLLGSEAKAVQPFVPAEDAAIGGQEKPTDGMAQAVSRTIDELLGNLNDTQKAVERELGKKFPNFKGAAGAAKKSADFVADRAAAMINTEPEVQKGPDFTPAFKKYMADSVSRMTEIKKIADDLSARAAKLGELKIDKLEQALDIENPILVLGENDWRVLSQQQVWQEDTDIRSMANGAKPKPRFAGEQQITTAIYSLESPTKQKICFVRPGGPPMISPGFPPFIQGGPLSMLAERLRQYNFDVTEKDLSGNWAMQAQMQQMPAGPEPSDEEIKDAIWVVIDPPVEKPGTPPTAIGFRLKEHLEQGGSALLLADVRSENLVDTLKDWGVNLHTDAIAVHETITLSDVAAADPIEEAKTRAWVWDCRNYGDHPIAKPLRSLDSVFVAPIVVRSNEVADCTVTPLLPFSANMPSLKTWGDVDIEGLDKGETPAYHPEKGDLPPPIYGGVAVEKKGKGRLVAFGSLRSFTNGFLYIQDPRLRQRDIYVNRFPGNQELATNSIFWLAHLETMIAISPSAMDVSRIADMSDGTLILWRCIWMILLPGAALAAGAFTYFARRD